MSLSHQSKQRAHASGEKSGRSPAIALITRTRTANQGNQALSIAWQDLLADTFPGGEVRLFERCPTYLKRYGFEQFARAKDPVALLDRIAGSLVAKASPTADRDHSVASVTLDRTIRPIVRWLGLRQRLNLRGRLLALGLGETDFLDRLAQLRSMNLVVMNPAGEFHRHASGAALQYLIEARCLQLAGVPLAIVNLSVETDHPVLLSLCDHVFANSRMVELRDHESVAQLRAAGFEPDAVVLPDAVILCDIERGQADGTEGVAFAINGYHARSLDLFDQTADVMDRIAATRRVVLTSNEWSPDERIWNGEERLASYEREGAFLDHDDYARFLGRYGVVVSSRLHSCVLGMHGGVPVIALEMDSFKLSGFFNMIGMAEHVIRADTADWQEQLIRKIEDFDARRDEVVAAQDVALSAARERLARALAEHLRAAIRTDALGEDRP